jgi:26S proteasome regulatory subunit N9
MAKPIDREAISDFLADQRDAAPAEDQHLFVAFDDLFDRKLWHQLTDRLLEFYARPDSGPQRLPIYNTFIVSFADKINQLKLVKLALSAASQFEGIYNPPARSVSWLTV